MINIFNIKEGLVIGVLKLNEFANLYNLQEKRLIESQAKEYLLNYILNDTVTINYDANGKPFVLEKPLHISISHSYNKIAIIVNNTENTGIDIEIIRDKVLKIKHKFLSELELQNVGNDAEKTLIYWGAKEALFKIFGFREVDFIKNLNVKPFIKHNLGTIIGEINMPFCNHIFELNYLKIDEYMMVYAYQKIK